MNKHYVSHFVTFGLFLLMPAFAPVGYRLVLAVMVLANFMALSGPYRRLRHIAGYSLMRPRRHLPLACDIALYAPSLYIAYCVGWGPLACLVAISVVDFYSRTVAWLHEKWVLGNRLPA